MTLYDTFPMRDELDLLECRLAELQDVADVKHVIVEATVDHQGHPKPLHLEANWERFKQWEDRMIYVPVDDLPADPATWGRENAQREATFRGLTHAHLSDLILHSDLDEIPSVSGVRTLLQYGHGALTQRVAVFAVDWELPYPWTGDVPVCVPLGEIRSFTELRHASASQYQRIPNGGWHMTWLGGNDAIWEKTRSYCHPEMDSYIAQGLGVDKFYGRGVFWGNCGHGETQLAAVDVDEDWPWWVRSGELPAWVVSAKGGNAMSMPEQADRVTVIGPTRVIEFKASGWRVGDNGQLEVLSGENGGTVAAEFGPGMWLGVFLTGHMASWEEK